MSKDYLLGIDIGTSACKVAIFNKNGKVMASANGDYPVYYPHEGWAQQKPDEWWHAVCGAICECLETGNISGEQIAGVGIDGQSWSLLPLTMRKCSDRYTYLDGYKSPGNLRQTQ